MYILEDFTDEIQRSLNSVMKNEIKSHDNMTYPMLMQLPNIPDRILLVASVSGRPAFLEWKIKLWKLCW